VVTIFQSQYVNYPALIGAGFPTGPRERSGSPGPGFSQVIGKLPVTCPFGTLGLRASPWCWPRCSGLHRSGSHIHGPYHWITPQGAAHPFNRSPIAHV